MPLEGKKYKEKADNRLKIAQINKKDLYPQGTPSIILKVKKIDYSEITPEYFIEKCAVNEVRKYSWGDTENYFFIVKKI